MKSYEFNPRCQFDYDASQKNMRQEAQNNPATPCFFNGIQRPLPVTQKTQDAS